MTPLNPNKSSNVYIISDMLLGSINIT